MITWLYLTPIKVLLFRVLKIIENILFLNYVWTVKVEDNWKKNPSCKTASAEISLLYLNGASHACSVAHNTLCIERFKGFCISKTQPRKALTVFLCAGKRRGQFFWLLMLPNRAIAQTKLLPGWWGWAARTLLPVLLLTSMHSSL